MNKYIKFSKLTLVTIISLISVLTQAQDVRFTQAMYNPLTINPSMMGLNTDVRAVLQTRSQWNGIEGGYKTYSLGLFSPLFIGSDYTKIDLGLTAINDVEGAYNTLNIALAGAYNFRLSDKSFLSLSLQGGFVQKSLDLSVLTFDEQYVNGQFDPTNPTNELELNDRLSAADFSTGVLWYTTPTPLNLGHARNIEFFTGLSVFHLTSPPNQSHTGLQRVPSRRFSLQGGFKVEGLDKVDVTPFVYVNRQAGNTNFALNILVDVRFKKYFKLTTGASYRAKDATSVLAGVEYNMFKLIYSYDIAALSPVSNSISSLHTHEVSLSFNLTDLIGMARPSYMKESFF